MSWEVTHAPYHSRRERLQLLLACAERYGARRWWWVDVPGAIELGASAPVASGETLVLQPRLFPGSTVPAWFVERLADSGRTALAVVRTHPDEPVPWARVGDELRRLYGALVPDAHEREAAMRLHARWLLVDAWRADPTATAGQALAARLAHVQVTRLRGPGQEPELASEAELVHALAV